MEPISLIDALLRGGAIAILLLIAVAVLAGTEARRRSASVSVLSVSIIAYLLISTPNLHLSNTWAAMPLIAIAGLTPILVYWAGAELFLDRFEAKWWHFLIALGIVAGVAFQSLVPAAASIRATLVIILYLHLLFLVWRSAPDDLVESRRVFRRWFLVLMAILGGVIALIELLGADDDLPAFLFPIHALAFLILALMFALWAFRIRDGIWSQPNATKPAAEPELAPADQSVLARLKAAMEDEIWRQEGLTVGQLAARIDTQEHRLRRVINQALGYRNFSAFINERRIETAKRDLADVDRMDTPVLTIAHDVGFGSLGPFNRAFRDATGQSPTDYRRTRGGQTH